MIFQKKYTPLFNSLGFCFDNQLKNRNFFQRVLNLLLRVFNQVKRKQKQQRGKHVCLRVSIRTLLGWLCAPYTLLSLVIFNRMLCAQHRYIKALLFFLKGRKGGPKSCIADNKIRIKFQKYWKKNMILQTFHIFSFICSILNTQFLVLQVNP